MMRKDAALAGASPHAQAAAQSSPIISALQMRHSILPPNGNFAQVTEAIINANSGAAAAELRVAQLRAEAKSKNWLPQLGPSVSLSSLSGLVASLTLSQPIFDHGRRKAERDFAAADVEVAAVSLSASMNQRAYEGLQYYILAERARAQAAVSERAAQKLAGFEKSMQTRVDGGLSDMSQQQVISQRYAEMQATVAADMDAAQNALGQLAAMTGQLQLPLMGMDKMVVTPSAALPLSVLRKNAEGKRMLAQAMLSRADMLPGITASAEANDMGVNPGLRLTGLGMVNPGASATMQALAETTNVVDAQNADAADVANRRLVALNGDITTLQNRQMQGAKLLARTESNLELFDEQYKVGRSTLLELVGQYDAYARLKRDQEAIRFEIALKQLEIARDLGLLVDGARL
ncbi:MAG: TolC family protein [Paracoccaceae bacterium]|nr:TolC family protein [Paracoccaceae bacterium]